MYDELCENVWSVVMECYKRKSDLPILVKKVYDIITITDCLRKELRKLELDGLDEFEKTVDQLNERLLEISRMKTESEEELLKQDESYELTVLKYAENFLKLLEKNS